MKSIFKKSLAFMMVMFLAVLALSFNNKVKAASKYVETSFGEGKILITTTFDGSTYYLPAATSPSAGPSAIAFTNVDEIGEENLWTITATGSNYYIQNSEGKYLYTTSTNNGVRVNTTANAWAYDSTNNSFKDTKTSRYLGIYNASNWRCYTSVTQSNYKESSTSFKFYKVNAAAPSVTITGDSYTKVGDVVTLTATTANVTGTVAWSSSNTDVATVDQSGNVTAKAFGQTTITASVDEVEDSIELTVYPTDGSELTIAQALQVCQYTGTENCAFTYSVTGVIDSIDTEYDSTNDRITVTISDGTNSIQAYRMDGGSDLEVGTKIKVTGTLVNYKGNTPEFVAGCTYEVVADDAAVSAAKEALNQIQAYMSFAYKYTREQQEITASSDPVTAAYTGSTTTNMAADANQAAIVGLNENLFNVEAIKNKPSNNIGLNKAGEIRLYANSADGNGNELVISTLNGQNITSIEITFGSTVGSFTVNGVAGAKETTEYAVNDTSVAIKNTTSGSSTQVHIKSITINLEASDEVTLVDVFTEVDFRIKCGVDLALADIAGVDSYGVKVSADKEMELPANESDDTCLFAVISLGDVLTNAERLDVVFTVQAYIVIEGVTYVSENTKSFSVREMVEAYYKDPETTDKVASLYELLQNL